MRNRSLFIATDEASVTDNFLLPDTQKKRLPWQPGADPQLIERPTGGFFNCPVQYRHLLIKVS